MLMNYNYFFNIAAIAISALVFTLYVFRENYPTRTRTVFIEFMVCTFVTAILDTVSNFTFGNPNVPDVVNYIIKGIFLI